MSRGHEYCRKLYGRAPEVKRDLGRLAEQVYADESMAYLSHPIVGDVPIFPEQYSALEEFFSQYGETPEEFLIRAPGAIVISDKHVTKIYVTGIEPKEKDVYIPKNLDHLEVLYWSAAKITSLEIPDTLTRLKDLRCGYNELETLRLPEKLTGLVTLCCYDNGMRSLDLPETLPNLVTLSCWNNRLTSLKIPETYGKLAQIGCKNNPLRSLSIPTSVPLEKIHCIDSKLSWWAKRRLRKRGIEVIDR